MFATPDLRIGVVSLGMREPGVGQDSGGRVLRFLKSVLELQSELFRICELLIGFFSSIA